ncbi:PilZ domain-containing protein [Massilia endophytica]|nr:PilZ domain-containing protein [Massilia endophytica]
MWLADGGSPQPARTSDLGTAGISITTEYRVDTGRTGQVVWEMLVDGRPQVLTARAKVAHCIYGDGAFKVGFSFLPLDNETQTAIAKFMR